MNFDILNCCSHNSKHYSKSLPNSVASSYVRYFEVLKLIFLYKSTKVSISTVVTDGIIKSREDVVIMRRFNIYQLLLSYDFLAHVIILIVEESLSLVPIFDIFASVVFFSRK